MATEQILKSVTATAGADLSTHQYKFVKLSANKTVVLCAAATDIPFGILQNDPTSGQAATVAVSGVSKVVFGASIAAGLFAGTSATGLLDAKTLAGAGTEFAVCQVFENGGGANAIGEVLLNTAVAGLAS